MTGLTVGSTVVGVTDVRRARDSWTAALEDTESNRFCVIDRS